MRREENKHQPVRRETDAYACQSKCSNIDSKSTLIIAEMQYQSRSFNQTKGILTVANKREAME
jgi:hypothetical protein